VASSVRPLLAETVTFLKEHGKYEHAAAVEAVNAPRGYLLLQRTETMKPRQLSLTATKSVRDQLRKAETEFEQVLDSLADKAYRLALAGEWLPPETKRPRRNRPGDEAAVLQVQVDSDLWEQVQQELPALSRKAGYKVTHSSIILAYLCDELGVYRGIDRSVPLVLPVELRDHFAAARESGTDLDALVNERVREMVDGSWSMPRPSKAQKGTWESERQAKIYVRLEPDVQEAVQDLAPQLSEQHGLDVTPGTIVRTILTDRLGQPAE
jgi:hypothetical protein